MEPLWSSERKFKMVRVILIEGSPSEVTEVINNAHVMQTSGVAIASATSDGKTAPISEEDEVADNQRVFVSEEVAHRVLSRRPLSKEQRALLVTLAKAYPDWVLATTLQKAVGYTPAQFAGLMGAFGRRFTHTDGWVEGSWLFDAEWSYDDGCYNYRLPETVRNAVKSIGIA
jgi:predicted transcriptional regulator with HTH domain